MNQPQLGRFESIPLSQIRPSATNPRKHFDPIAMEELTRSVQEMGVTQPLIVRQRFRWIVCPNKLIQRNRDACLLDVYGNPETKMVFGDPDASVNEVEAARYVEQKNAEDPGAWFEIVSGERRYQAAKSAGRTVVPAIVRELSDEDALDMQMVENLQRVDLHPVEEADGYRVLMANGATAEDVAKKSGKTLGYVQQRLKLLTLEVDAKHLFADGHLTLGHALHLARLTPRDQENALRFLLNGNGDHAKTPIAELIPKRIRNLDTSWNRGRRLIDAAEGQLKEWIASHILLQLAGVPWHLADASLLPIAGACTTCPKRTGANAALFQDLTADEDTCTDPACFADKQKAQAQRQIDAAKTAGTPLLKISSKQSHDKLEQKPVQVVKGRTEVVASKPVKQGQWVPAKEGECNGTVAALAVDGADKGKVTYVCADQACKVHKHQVVRPAAQGARQDSWEVQRKKREEEARAEHEVRRRMLQDFTPTEIETCDFLSMFFVEWLGGNNHGVPDEGDVCERLGITFDAKLTPGMSDWQVRDQRNSTAREPLKAWLEDADDTCMQRLGFHSLSLWVLDRDDYIDEDSMPLLHRMLDRAGYDPKATEAEVRREIAAESGLADASNEVAKVKGGKKKLTAAEQVDRKKAAAKEFPGKAKKSFTLTPEARKRIVEAQKKQWAKAREKREELNGKPSAEMAGA